ncbi:tetratricopeptide repeat protein [Kineosporia sp. J2-2]|uniref:Tetratricopeptide repeat protein n=1 Tax=Kineosporia corallincola TaxID=2835133 RepID=A0ABS5TB51_9ACTN|nr:tetratricopeptide repeat protein [Kineosporia corallincola]MBT0768300.1 tetratricopeptide repeat protein [Kineosporia corallincola]
MGDTAEILRIHQGAASTLPRAVAVLLLDVWDAADERPLTSRVLVEVHEPGLPAHPRVVLRGNGVAFAMFLRQDGSRVRSLAARAVALTEQAVGAEHPYAATQLGHLAVALTRVGEWSEAAELLERALGVTLAAAGRSDLRVARHMNNLGLVRLRLEETEAGLSMLERARSIAEQENSAGPELAAVLSNLARARLLAGDADGARQILSRATQLAERLDRVRRPESAAYTNNLAVLLSAHLDLPIAARPLAREALRLGESSGHGVIDTYLRNLAVVMRALGEEETARDLEARAVRQIS